MKVLKSMGLRVSGGQWWGWVAASLTWVSLWVPGEALAQAISPELRDRFLSDPALTEPRDPLLPVLPVVRPLSPLEQSDLAVALDALAEEAQRLYALGQTNQAFDLWMREVRLRRLTGLDPELAAIQRVGLRAWESSRTVEVQLLTLRLQQIRDDLLAQTAPDIARLEQVVAAFEVLRDVNSAIAVYDALIERVTQTGTPAQQLLLLERKGILQESWFRFEAAADTYQRVLAIAEQQRSSSGDLIRYLRRAVYNTQKAEQLATAIDYQRRLVRQYEAIDRDDLVPPVKLEIARNYRDLGQLEQAVDFYQAVYAESLDQDLSSYARDAVADLAVIYLALDRPDDVEYLYEQQLAVERLSYNGYNIMQVFDQLGQFYEGQDNLDAAIAAYREGLILARHLNHRTAYFESRIQQIQIAQGVLTLEVAESHLTESTERRLENPDTWQGNRLNTGNVLRNLPE